MSIINGIDPAKYFERRGRHSESLIIKTVGVSATVGSNRTVVAAVSGKRIRVMGYQIQSTGATQGAFVLKDGSGGSQLGGSFTAPPSTAAPMKLEVKEGGYFETTAGNGLFADITTATVQIEVSYIEYTP